MSEIKKPLGEWTLGEVKAECDRHGIGCDGCTFSSGFDTAPCQLMNDDILTPMEWDFLDPDSREPPAQADYEPATVDKPKPRLCTILGVEVGEPFSLDGFSQVIVHNHIYHVDMDGVLHNEGGAATPHAAVYAINHPEAIVRVPQWDEDEMAVMRYLYKLGGKAVTADGKGIHIAVWSGLWDEFCFEDGEWSNGAVMAEFYGKDVFPHLKPGELVRLEDVVGGDTYERTE